MARLNLVSGNIALSLWKVAYPIMITMFIQMTYNLADIFWLGKLGTTSVAAASLAGLFMWIANSITMMTKTGVEVGVAQSVGSQDSVKQNLFANNGIRLALLTSIFYAAILLIFAPKLISFFALNDVHASSTNSNAILYLRIIAFGMPFLFLNSTYSGIFNAEGNSKASLKYNAVGLLLNLILDPIFIFYLNGGIAGAAIATVIAQAVVTGICFYKVSKESAIIRVKTLYGKITLEYAKKIFKVGIPAALQSILFAFITIVIYKMVAKFGTTSVAAQSIGAQVEAISWMTAGGFSTALAAFVGQNLGAREISRVKAGYKVSMYLMIFVGLISSLLFYLFPTQIYSIFVSDPETILKGTTYMRILALIQIFQSLEVVTQGAFYGIGKAKYPFIVSLLFNAARIPGGYFLSLKYGVVGIWIMIAISCFFKGTILSLLWFIRSRRLNDVKVI